MPTAAAARAFSSSPTPPLLLRAGSRIAVVSFQRRFPPAPALSLSVSAPSHAPSSPWVLAANPKYHNAKVDAGDEEVNGDELLRRFTREVARAGVMHEVRRRRRHEDARDKRKRKSRDAAWRFRRRRVILKSYSLDPEMFQAMEGLPGILIPIQELMRKTTERLEANLAEIGTKIHRFPRGLRGIGSLGERYIIPSFVALGPYHHGSTHLQEVEEVKYAAAHYFCMESGHSVKDVYGKIHSISAEARGCYADDVVTHFSVAEFALMMFLDGCFLLHYISNDRKCTLLANRMVLSTGPCIGRDIFLLENQLPWLVLEALMTFSSVDVYDFVVSVSLGFSTISVSDTRLSEEEFHRYRPPHLLGLLRHYLIACMPPEDPSYKYLGLGSSAIELAEIGIKLTASNKRWFADMSIQKGFITGELSLTPLYVNDVNACWLINMAAFEACMSTNYPYDGFVVSSYLSLVAMLVDSEEDVHELRAKHLIRSSISNREMLDFFKGLSRHLRLGHRYYVICHRIEEYKHEKRVQIAVHKFIYNNFKTIAALLSIAGVLVGIFQAILSLKEHPQQ